MKNNWISVADRLPETDAESQESKVVIFRTIYSGVTLRESREFFTLGVYSAFSTTSNPVYEWYDQEYRPIEDTVTHWQYVEGPDT